MNSKSILQKLFDGEIFPGEDIKSDSPRYREIMKQMGEDQSYLIKNLSESDGERVKSMYEKFLVIYGMYGYECFSHGFRLCHALMLECLQNTEDLAREAE